MKQTVQRISEAGGEPMGVCVGFRMSDQDLADRGGAGDDWPLDGDDGSEDACQWPDGRIQVKAGERDLMVWRTREEAEGVLMERRRRRLTDKAARFLNDHTNEAIGADFTDGSTYSLEELFRIITLRADDGDPDCKRFLDEEVPWEDVGVPDPLGWANRG